MNKDEFRKKQDDLIRKQTDLAALLAEQERVDSLLSNLIEMEAVEEARQNLKAFFVLAWELIEPGKAYMDNWHVDCICDHLEAVQRGQIQNLILQVPPRHSKQISKDTLVLTENKGWVTHGELKVGDYVFDPGGVPVKVVRVSPDSISDTKVTFTNGEEIYCNKEHLWEVWDKNSRKTYVKETQELYGKETRTDGEKKRYRFFVPNIEPVQFENKNLPLDPYYLGNWLGDGYEKSNRITQSSLDKEIIEKIPYEVSTFSVHPETGVVCYYFSKQSIDSNLKSLGVWGNKYIPNEYKYSSIEQRKELIAGLIDSDGSVDSNGRVTFVNCNKRLIDDVYQVLVSLGQRPYLMFRSAEQINKYKEKSQSYKIVSKQDVWIVGFQPTISFPTALPRKKITRLIKQRRVAIKKIEYLSPQEQKTGNCITVDSKRGVYLVGKNCIPTHNSSIASVVFPAWSWLQDPTEKFITASAIEKLVIRDAVRSRRLVTSSWYRNTFKPEFELQKDVNQKSRYENTLGGYRYATSVTSSAIGEGYSILVVDDPVKPADVTSKAVMETTLEWWTQTISTRKNSADARRVLLHQRLAVNDPIGWELKNNEGLWENVCLPMEFEPERKFFTSIWEDPRKKEGECLWPERFPPAELKNLKRVLGPFGTAAQLQQNPVPREGGIIKKEWIISNLHNEQFNQFNMNQFDLVVGSWDLTFSNTGDSWNVGTVIGRKGADKYVLDMWRGRYDIIQQREAIRQMFAKYPQIRAMLIEKKANGEAAQRMLKKEIPGILLIDPREIGSGDKEARLSACAIDFEAGNVHFPQVHKATWVETAIEEITLFPRAPHDDIVDSVSMALNWIAFKGGTRGVNVAQVIAEKQKFQELMNGKVAPSRQQLNKDGTPKEDPSQNVILSANFSSAFSTGFGQSRKIFGSD